MDHLKTKKSGKTKISRREQIALRKQRELDNTLLDKEEEKKIFQIVVFSMAIVEGEKKFSIQLSYLPYTLLNRNTRCGSS